jgi:hypothetical protein
VAKLEALASKYAAGGSARDFVAQAQRIAGVDAVAATLPDIIGALPAGEQKKALFRVYSTQ